MTAVWDKRIVGTGEAAPADLRANPLNWRRHPPGQHAALREMLESVGWVQQVVVNQRTGNLVDGHLRVELAQAEGEPAVPVLYVDLDESEERKVLAALDPIAALAEADTDALRGLLEDVALDGDALSEMFAAIVPVVPEVDGAGRVGEYLEAMKVSLGEPEHQTVRGEVWQVGTGYLVVASVYDGWPIYVPLLTEGRLLVPYPSPIVPLTQRARNNELVMVQPDPWLAGHLLDKFAQVYGDEMVARC